MWAHAFNSATAEIGSRKQFCDRAGRTGYCRDGWQNAPHAACARDRAQRGVAATTALQILALICYAAAFRWLIAP